MSGPVEEKPSRKRNPVENLKGPTNKRAASDRSWDESFEVLRSYKQANGDCHVPLRYKNDQSLGQWVQRQRCSTTLTCDQRNRLNALGFDWEMLAQRNARVWNEKFTALKDFRRIYGHCRVPVTTVDPELQPWAEKLGSWVKTQRSKKQRRILDTAMEARLDSIGFEWKLQDKNRGICEKEEQKWLERFAELEKFRSQHGHTMVPNFYEKDKGFGHWVHWQRYSFSKGILRQDRKDKLDEVGFVWRIDRADPNASVP